MLRFELALLNNLYFTFQNFTKFFYYLFFILNIILYYNKKVIKLIKLHNNY